MTETVRLFARLSHAEALRGLYIDFEGGKDQTPVLLGVHRRGRGARPFVHWTVLDPLFSGLGQPVATLHEAVANVVERARFCHLVKARLLVSGSVIREPRNDRIRPESSAPSVQLPILSGTV
jgi:hypothetical protein